MKVKEVGHAGLTGWKEKVADRVAPAVAGRTRFGEDQVRAAVGGVFFVLATVYVVKTAATVIRELRGG